MRGGDNGSLATHVTRIMQFRHFQAIIHANVRVSARFYCTDSCAICSKINKSAACHGSGFSSTKECIIVKKEDNDL